MQTHKLPHSIAASRRSFLKTTLGASAGLLIPACMKPDTRSAREAAAGRQWAGSFRFVHMTDIHVKPELHAAEGLARALTAAESLNPRPDFILTGGDNIMDALEVSHDRAVLQFDLFKKVVADNTSLVVRPAVGNHDVYGWYNKNGTTPDSPQYGKQMVGELLALESTYYHFDHKGWRFFVLDNIQPGQGKRGYQGFLDNTQREWLTAELARTPRDMPIVVCEHIPSITVTPMSHDTAIKDGDWAIDNSWVCNDAAWKLETFKNHRVTLWLSGHIHERDDIQFQGIRFINDGAVSGNWWRGAYRGVEEGFGVVDVAADGSLTHHYHDYGWTADA